MSDQPDEDLYLTIHRIHNRDPAMPPTGFQASVPASERLQTNAIGIGSVRRYKAKY
jgi:hypothetical protein